MTAVPARDGADAPHVNWPDLEIAGQDGARACRNSFIADNPVEPKNAAELADRVRPKVGTEACQVPKGHRLGYRVEHDFGRGKSMRASVAAVLNNPAFAMHGAGDLFALRWRQARETTGARTGPFGHIRPCQISKPTFLGNNRGSPPQ